MDHSTHSSDPWVCRAGAAAQSRYWIEVHAVIGVEGLVQGVETGKIPQLIPLVRPLF